MNIRLLIPIHPKEIMIPQTMKTFQKKGVTHEYGTDRQMVVINLKMAKKTN